MYFMHKYCICIVPTLCSPWNSSTVPSFRLKLMTSSLLIDTYAYINTTWQFNVAHMYGYLGQVSWDLIIY